MKKSKSIKSLNSTLPEFSLAEIEQRLETDPLKLGGLINLNDPSDPNQSGKFKALLYEEDDNGDPDTCLFFSCGEYNSK